METGPSLFPKVLLYPDHIRIPNKPKYVLLLLEKLLLQSRGAACVGCSLDAWPEAPAELEMGINNIFLVQIQEYWGALLLWSSASAPCSVFGIRLAGTGGNPWEVVTSSVSTAWRTQGASGERETTSRSKRIRKLPPWAPEAARQSSESVWALLHLISLTPPKQVPRSPSSA